MKGEKELKYDVQNMLFYTGVIERGTSRATGLGFPTINISIAAEGNAVSGTYAARVFVEGAFYNAAAYANIRKKILEAHLFNFSGDLYGCEASIQLCEKIRNDEFFEDEEKLVAAIIRDIERIRKYFEK